MRKLVGLFLLITSLFGSINEGKTIIYSINGINTVYDDAYKNMTRLKKIVVDNYYSDKNISNPNIEMYTAYNETEGAFFDLVEVFKQRNLLADGTFAKSMNDFIKDGKAGNLDPDAQADFDAIYVDILRKDQY